MAEATIPQTAAADKKASRWAHIKEMFAEMDRLHAQMKRDREEIHRLSTHTRANIAEIEAALDRIAAA